MQVRRFRESDRSSLAALNTTVCCAARARLWIEDDGTFAWRPEPIAPFEKSYDFDDSHAVEDTIVAVDDDSGVLGVAATTFHGWNRRTVLDAIYVDRGQRRRGVGRQLLTACLDRANSDGARHLWLETQDINCHAIAFYERLGFAIVGLDQSLYAAPHSSEVAIFMARELC
jgi:ribosomal protein S18 acetylase RimI-like enzyme